jgi:L-2-hydroxyglutarate oxidase
MKSASRCPGGPPGTARGHTMSGTSGTADVTIVGAGIVGLATAYTLLQRTPALRVTVLEKEGVVGRHQTGHNSGVIHSGVYYRPGSAKARMCLRGRELMIGYCESKGIPMRQTGKLIIATEPTELSALAAIRERAAQNGISDVLPLTAEEIRAREPEARGLAGLEVPSTAIVDYRQVLHSLVEEITARGGEICFSSRPTGMGVEGDRLLVRTSNGDQRTRFLVNCAGLYSDRIARMAGVTPPVQIVPFRGEYYEVRPQRAFQLDHLLYPVPNPTLPFLGVHLTLMMGGTITAGPNAVLAGAREGYTRTSVSWPDAAEMTQYPGFWRMARRFWWTGVYEQFRSLSREQYAEDLRRMTPGLTADDLRPGGAGVRAQAVDRDGKLVDDFVFESGPRSLHVLNAPSPAATSSLAIAEEIVQRIPAAS